MELRHALHAALIKRVYLVATKVEATGLVNALRLKPVAKYPVTYAAGQTACVVLGMGASSTERLRQFIQRNSITCDATWINFGIAGYATGTIGDWFVGSELRHADWCRPLNTAWVIGQSEALKLRILPVRNLDVPSAHYRADELFDMEAALLFKLLLEKYARLNFYCIKRLSDTLECPLSDVNKAFVSKLVTSDKHVYLAIDQLIQQSVTGDE